MRSALRRPGRDARRRTSRRRSRCASAPRRSPTRRSWIQTADEIKTLQAEWKTIGPVSRGQEKAIWERFRAACDRFFTRRHEDLAERKTVWAENFAKKEALCVQVEALADSTDWDADRGRDQAAAGRVEDDRPGEEEPVGGDLAALPRAPAIASSPATRSVTTLRAANASRRAKRFARSSKRCAGPAATSDAVGGRRSRRAGSRSPSVRDRCARAGSRSSRRAASIATARRALDRALCRRVRAACIARWPQVVRRHRSRSRREPQADGSARRAASRSSRASLGGPAVAAATRRCRRRRGSPRC